MRIRPFRSTASAVALVALTSFAQAHPDLPPAPGNWGDRDFIAAGRGSELFLTWDYGPSASAVRTLCARGGSCSYTAAAGGEGVRQSL